MTPARQPHRQRCETCKHYNDETETEYGMCYAESGHREQMYNNTFDHVAKYGCASHSGPPAPPRLCDECNILELEAQICNMQPLIDFVRSVETKNREMAALMKRNGMKIDNLDDPMQKLAFTFYSEIGEMAHKAEAIIKEYEESLRGGGA